MLRSSRSKKRQAVTVTLFRLGNSGCLIGCGKVWLGRKVPYGHGACNSRVRPSRKVTCVSDVSWGRGPSFLRFQSKQKGHQFPSKFLFSFYIHNTFHIQTKDQSTYTKTTFNKQIQPLKWTQFRKLTVACISSLMQYNTWLTCILKERSQLGHRHRQEHCGLHF